MNGARRTENGSKSGETGLQAAALMLPVLPKASDLLGDKGYDADWFRAALLERSITACIPSKSNRKV